ncbi:hypothetical protein MTO96_003422 [Rhipicephalus appendiculatus]
MTRSSHFFVIFYAFRCDCHQLGVSAGLSAVNHAKPRPSKPSFYAVHKCSRTAGSLTYGFTREQVVPAVDDARTELRGSWQ